MFEKPDRNLDIADADLLGELQQSTPEAIKGARAHTRLTIRTKVIVQPANMSQRLSMKVQGVSGDISAGGCQLLLPLPIQVADIFWLTFDREVVDIPPVYGRCMRCRVIREDAFEAGFAFFKPVDLSFASKQNSEQDDSLI